MKVSSIKPGDSMNKKKIIFLVASTSIYLLLLLLSLMDLKINAQKMTTSSSTTTETIPFLTVEKPTLGFRISYPSDWNITDNDLVISFRAPQNAALVTFSITNLSSKANLTLEQYSSNEINTIKLIESKKAGNFKFLESTSHLLSGEPGHAIVFLNGTNADARHNYKTGIVWTAVDGKVYQIRYSAEISKYPTYAPTVIDIINSFELL
jgi:hypothetical protein